MPPAGCPSLGVNTGCNDWSGCTAQGSSCIALPCNEMQCGISNIIMQAAGNLAPGCLQGDAVACDDQRLRVFSALQLGPGCAANFLPALAGGATLGIPNPAPDSLRGDVVVDPNVGNDATADGSAAKPFLTIQAALQHSRVTMIRGQSTRRVVLRQGVHRLAQPVQLLPVDAGLTIQGQPGAVVSGAIKLPVLQWATMANGVMWTTLPSSVLKQLDKLSLLYVNGAPAIRARYPNIGEFLATAFAPSTQISYWYPRKDVPALTKSVHVGMNLGNTMYNAFNLGYGGPCTGVFTPAASYFCSPNEQSAGGCQYSISAGVQLTPSLVSAVGLADWSAAGAGGLFHAWHLSMWSLWSFETSTTATVQEQQQQDAAVPPEEKKPRTTGRRLKSKSATTPSRLYFNRGGFQEARGDCGFGGGDFFVENILQLLDAPNEFYLDVANARLYFKPNGTWPDAAGVVLEMSAQRELFRVSGSLETSPVSNVAIRGIKLVQTYATFMDDHEVASAGDWTINRSGAVLIENATDVLVADCAFEYLGGNGVFVSNYARDIVVTRNTFYALGSSAMLSSGSNRYEADDPWNYSTAQSYPINVEFSFNMASELGMTFKQSAGVFVAISKNVLVRSNVIFNGARAGISQNDGFGGGNTYVHNVLFNLVRETLDQGPFNAWDRQRWLEPGPKDPSSVIANLFFGNQPGPKGVDLDDGVDNWVVTANVIFRGYQKFKGANIISSENLIISPLQTPQKTSGCVYLNAAQHTPANFKFTSNTCVSTVASVVPYSFTSMLASQAAPLCALANFYTFNNTFYGFDPQSDTFKSCNFELVNFVQWKGTGQDAQSSTTQRLPANQLVLAWVMQTLPWTVA